MKLLQYAVISFFFIDLRLIPMIEVKNPYIIEKAGHLAIMATDNTWISHFIILNTKCQCYLSKSLSFNQKRSIYMKYKKFYSALVAFILCSSLLMLKKKFKEH